MKARTIATALILSFAAIGAAQATPRGDTDNVPFQGTYSQNDDSAASPQAMASAQDTAVYSPAYGDSDNVPFQG